MCTKCSKVNLKSYVVFQAKDKKINKKIARKLVINLEDLASFGFQMRRSNVKIVNRQAAKRYTPLFSEYCTLAAEISKATFHA